MKVDTLIKNAFVFNTFRKSFEKKNVSIAADKFYYISKEELDYLEADTVIEAGDQYMIPGLIDIHMHIESSMTTPGIFSPAVLPFGVTTIVADAHEIANVFGIEGLRHYMAAQTDLDIFYAIPSSVPSTAPELETTGGVIGVAEAKELLKDPKMICLGEAMNFKGIASEPASLIRQIIAACLDKNPLMPLEGHCPKIYAEDLAAFLYSGISSDHTHQFPESLLEKIENGMFIEFQKKSITKENMAVIKDNHFYEYACFITDDVMADELLEGHLNENVKTAIACGIPVAEAIYMTTYTPAMRMGFHDRGVIAPGKKADFILLRDPENLSIEAVYKDGKCVHREGEPQKIPQHSETFPDTYYQSVHCKKLVREDLLLQVETTKPFVRCNVIRTQAAGTFTEKIIKEIEVKNGILQWEAAGCGLLIVMERYGKNGNCTFALLDQPLTAKGAVATTWAHDHHNLMVMGTDAEHILLAQHKLLHMQGGYVVTHDENVQAVCALPVGGIVSQAPIEELGSALKAVRKAMQQLGYKNGNEIMSFSTLSLPVSPAVKVTDVGIMDTYTQEWIPLIVPEDGRLIK